MSLTSRASKLLSKWYHSVLSQRFKPRHRQRPTHIETLEPRVLLSGSTFQGLIDMSDYLDGTRSGALVYGADGDVNFAGRVADAGDVNGDGYDDFLINASLADSGGDYVGKVFLVYGQENLSGQWNTTDLADGTIPGAVFVGINDDDHTGAAIASAGDVNNDGYDDILITAPYTDDIYNVVGMTYLIYGQATGLTGEITLSSVTEGTVEGAIFKGYSNGSYTGTSVSSAGDVNGDGFDDFLVGAKDAEFWQYDDTVYDQGRIFLIYGQEEKFSGSYRLRDVGTIGSNHAAGTVFNGEGFHHYAGNSVSEAGDVNGDGFDDFLIGASWANGTNSNEGRSYLIFGQAQAFDSSYNLSAITEGTLAGAVFAGASAGDYSGTSVSTAGDVNGDGYDDFLISAKSADPNANNSGQVYLLYGHASDWSGAYDLADLISGQLDGAVFNGVTAGDYLGSHVNTAGDINDDGFDDFLFSSYGNGAGQVYLIYGHQTDLTGIIELSQIDEQTTWAAQFNGISEFDYTGQGLAPAGDINQDGYLDFLIAAPGVDLQPDDSVGLTYLILGGPGATLSGTVWKDDNNAVQDEGETGLQGVTVNLLDSNDQLLATTLTDASGQYQFTQLQPGDYRVQVEGIDDWQVVTKDQGDDDAIDSDLDPVTLLTGVISLVDGQVLDKVDIGLYNVPPYANAGAPYTIGIGDALKLSGHASVDPAHDSIFYAWDLDGDGQFDDASGINPVLTWDELSAIGLTPGEFEIALLVTDIVGNTDTATTTLTVNDEPLPRHIELSDIVNGTVDGAAFDGESALDQSGRTVRNAGDVNGDGYDDFLIRTFIGDADSASTDSVYLIYGQADQYTGNYSLSDIIDGTVNGAIFTGIGPTDYISIPMDGGGDVNNDGYDDIAIGVYTNDFNGMDSGRVYVIHGHATDLTGQISINGLGTNSLTGSIINGYVEGDQAGYSVAWGGDVDGDGKDELLIGSNRADNMYGQSWAGVVSVVYGSSLTTGEYDLGGLTTLDVNGYRASDYNGTTVSPAGDVNGDGYDDLLMSAVGAGFSGEVYLYYGGAYQYTGTLPVHFIKYGMRPGAVFEGIDANDSFGYSTDAVGDVNGDGYDDFIISSRLADEFGGQTGETYLVYGKSTKYSGTNDISSIITGQIDGAVFYGIYEDDQSGYSISGVGDINGDGFDDLFIGSHQADPDLVESAGESYLVFGDSTALTGEILLRDLNVGDVEGLIFEGENQYDHAGISVSGAGDVNNDGYADLLIGAYQADPNELDRAGRTYLIYGGEPEPLPLPEISGRAWNDVNGNGIQDAGEASLAGVAVELVNTMDEQTIMTTVTDSRGAYEFDNINYPDEWADYTIQFQLPEGYIFSQQYQGSDNSLDSDVHPGSGQTSWFNGMDTEQPLVFDAGLQALVTISGNVQFVGPESGQIITGISTVPLDQSSPSFDVIYNSDVDLILNVYQGVVSVNDGFGLIVNTSDSTITLSDLADATTTTQSDSNWIYRTGISNAMMFDLLPGVGMGSVGPDTQLLTSLLEDGETLEDIDSQSYYMNISRLPGAEDGTYQIINTLSIGNRTAQMVTTIHGSQGNLDFVINEVSRVSAGIDLQYEQSQEASGEYQLTVPTGAAPLWVNAFVDINGNGLLDENEPYTSTETSYADISDGLENIDLTFGVPHNSTIGDKVWHDLDADGIQDDDEPAMANVTVNLLDDQDAIIATTLTDAEGQYLFTDLGPGDYAVEFVASEGYVFTVDQRGADTALDSDADQATGITPTITLDGQAGHVDVDAGFVQPGSISGLTYIDFDHNDVYDDSDQLLADTVVYLDANNNAQLDWTDANHNDVWDMGEGEQWTVSDQAGGYTLDNVAPGDVVVRQITPDDLTVTQPDIAPVLELISRSERDVLGNGGSYISDVSADGRYVVFRSHADNLVAGDTNGEGDIFVYDRYEDILERVSVSSDGEQADGLSTSAQISGDGRYVVFSSDATNLVEGDTNGDKDIFVHDRQTGVTKRVSVLSDGTQANHDNIRPTISTDGRYIAFEGYGSRFAEEADHGTAEIYLYDQQTGELEYIDVALDDTQRDRSMTYISLSADGRLIAFSSYASNLVENDTNNSQDVFVYDRQTQTTRRVSVAFDGSEANSSSDRGMISDDGNHVVFHSFADGLSGDDDCSQEDVFVYDMITGHVDWISQTSDRQRANNGSEKPQISADGRYVVYRSSASNLGENDILGTDDIFLYDRVTGIVEQVSPTITNGQLYYANNAFISADGSVIVFDSNAHTFAQDDTNDSSDAFVFYHDLGVNRMALTSGQVVDDADFSYTYTGTVGDFVWNDINGNGVQDDDEPGLAGVTVHLLDDQGQVLWTTVTDEQGAYLFDQLAPGDYMVEFQLQDDMAFSPQFAGSDTAVDSNVSTTTGRSELFTLLTNQTNTSVDAGMGQWSSIQGVAFVDINLNDQVDGDDLKLQDVQIYLDENDNRQLDWTDANENGLWDLGEGERWTVTDSVGWYGFDTVPVGDYVVRQITPQNYQVTSPGIDEHTELVSYVSATEQTNGSSHYADMTPDGRYVVFYSSASNLENAQAHSGYQVYVRDLWTGEIDCVSLTSDGQVVNGDNDFPRISDDGRYVVFQSEAPQLVDSDTNQYRDILVHDRQTGQTKRISILADGTQSNGDNSKPMISGDGRYIAFLSRGNTFDPRTSAFSDQLYLYDQQTDELELLEVFDDDAFYTYSVTDLSLSYDGRYVAFSTWAPAIEGDTNGLVDAYVYDRQSDELKRISLGNEGQQADANANDALISSDGRYVIFNSYASNLVSNSTQGQCNTYLYDMTAQTLSMISVAPDGSMADGDTLVFDISSDGRFVAMRSNATNLLEGRSIAAPDLYVFDLSTGERWLATPGVNGQGVDDAYYLAISDDGHILTYDSSATNAVDGDTNNTRDIFVYRRDQAVHRISLTTTPIDSGLDFAYTTTGSVADTVWLDSNANGLQDDGEVGLSDITVNLLDEQSNVIATTQTDSNGDYNFSDLALGQYQLEVILPDDYLFTTQNVGDDDAIDSDIDPDTGLTNVFDVSSTQPVTGIAAGLYQLGSISGITYLDINQDDAYDAGDQLLAGTLVYLDADNDGQLDWADANDNDIWDAGEGEQWTVSDQVGLYTLDYVAPGDHVVRQITPNGLSVSYPGEPQLLELISRAENGEIANDTAGTQDISADGRYIVTNSPATNLVDNDTNGTWDIFVIDRIEGTVERVSVSSEGEQGNGMCYNPQISGDGRYVVFTSESTNLVDDDTNGHSDIFVHDRQTGQTKRVSVLADGTQANRDSYRPVISADGRYIAFEGSGTSFAEEANYGTSSIYLYDQQTGELEFIDAALDDTQRDEAMAFLSLSGDGRMITFWSIASNLVEGDTNECGDIFVYDRQTQTTRRVSVAYDGSQLDDYSYGAVISDDGNYVAFYSEANGVSGDDDCSERDVYVYDLTTGDVDWISQTSDGQPANRGSESPRISADGRFVVYRSRAYNLGENDINGDYDAFLFDRVTREVMQLSPTDNGGQLHYAGSVHISADGNVIVFHSDADTYAPDDTDDTIDSFVLYNDFINELGVYQLTMTSGQVVDDADFVYILDGNISDTVWLDSNANGLQDEGEVGLPNITVNLLDDQSNVIATTLTDSDGDYVFDELLHAQYQLEVVLPDGYLFSTQDVGNDDTIDSDVDPDTGLTSVFDVTSSQTVTGIAAGLFEQNSISGTIWDDLNADGIQDQNEPAVAGQTVNLLDDEGLVVDSTVTDADGDYQFVNQLPGDYQIQFVPDVEYALTLTQQGDDTTVDSDADQQSGNSAMFNLTLTQQLQHMDAGFVMMTIAHSGFYTINEGESLSLDASATQTYDAQAQYAWDLDEDGQYDDAFGVQPTLSWEQVQNLGLPTDGSTSTIRVQVTDVSGTSHDTGTLTINNVAPVVDPAPGLVYSVGFGLTVQLHGTATDVSSDPLTYVWDLDGDGIFGETGADAARGDETGQTPVFDAAGLDADTSYAIQLAVSDDMTTTTEQTFVMVGGASSIGDRIWHDLDADNVQDENEPGLAGVTVKLYKDISTVLATTTTDADGNYLFDNLVTGEYFVEVIAPENYGFTPDGTYNDTIEGSGDIIISLDSFDQSTDQSTVVGTAITSSSSQTVFAKSSAITLGLDEQIDTVDVGLYQPASISGTTWQDLNGDDIHDANDQVLPGVTVFLDEDANGLLDWTDTNANEQWDAGEGEMWIVSSDLGEYSFTNLLPGTYAVSQLTPVNYQLNTNDGQPFLLDIASDQNVTDIDFGYFSPVISDRVWFDDNGNGLQDDGEAGLANITVNLLDDEGNQLQTTTTDANGQYLFTALATGDYIVEFVLPDDYVFTHQDVGVDDTIDSDADRVTGRTGLITLADSDVVTSVDAGMMPAFEIVDEHLFHNDTYYDGNGTAVDSQDSQAIDERVQMLQPGELSTSVNYSTNLDGITGIMIDGVDLHLSSISAEDFIFKVGHDNDTANWQDAPTPTQVLVLAGEGVGGSDRIAITWDAGAITDQWLQVTIRKAGHVNVLNDEVFYVGNCIGDANGSGSVGIDDVFAIWNNRHSSASNESLPAGSKYDLNQDGAIDIADVFLAWNHRLDQNNVSKYLASIQPTQQVQQINVAQPQVAENRLALAISSMQGRYELNLVAEQDTDPMDLGAFSLTEYLPEGE